MIKFVSFLIFLVLNAQLTFAQFGTAQVSCKSQFLIDGDSVKLTMYKYGYHFNRAIEMQNVYYAIIKDNKFSFKIPTGNYPIYFDLNIDSFPSYRNLAGYIIEKGDNINIFFKKKPIEINNIAGKNTVKLNEETTRFKGRGTEKLNLISILKQMNKASSIILDRNDSSFFLQDFGIKDSIYKARKKKLENNRIRISPIVFNMISADLISDNLSKYYPLTFMDDKDGQKYRNHLSMYEESSFIEKELNDLINTDRIDFSSSFANSLISKYKYDSCFMKQKSFILSNYYEFVSENYSQTIKEKVIANLLYNHQKDTDPLLIVLLRKAVNLIQNSDFKQLLQHLILFRSIGAPSYQFELPDTSGNIFESSTLFGKVVLLDFWYTGCPACSQMQPYLQNIAHHFEGKNIEFVSISIDKSKSKFHESVKRGTYTLPQGVNLYTNGEGKLHPIIKHYQIMGYPTLILIGKDGKLRANSVDPRIDNGENLIELIKEALVAD